jgi:ParB-like chromosome segregation protein Spo0J
MENQIKDYLLSIKNEDELIEKINSIKKTLHEVSPFKNEPVDCVIWVKSDDVNANDYNPNSVAPPEMKLLSHSINNDGYTQPVVTWDSGKTREVIDGFHRTRVCKEDAQVRARVKGYIPVVTANNTCTSRNDRMASTIRHNRARGKHNVTAMSDIVTELKNRNWKNSRIARELGMDEDEVLRLCQITGLESLFSDRDFSKSWVSKDSQSDFTPISDEFDDYVNENKTPNTSDENRIFHTFDKWECKDYGFYESTKEGMKAEECKKKYAELLADLDLFRECLEKVTSEWKHSCEHYLTNKSMNRVAWLGQACLAYKYNIPSKFCSGFQLLTEREQIEANLLAWEYLNKWLESNGMEKVTYEEAILYGRQVEIY